MFATNSFWELYNSAGPEDQQQLADHLIAFLQGRKVPPIMKRFSFSASGAVSEEEIIAKIAGLMNVSPEAVKIDIEREKQRNIREHADVQQVIDPYLQFLKVTQKASKDKYEELDHVGRFIRSSQLGLELIVPAHLPIYPDFTVALNELRIGIEHTRLIETRQRRTTRTAQKFLEDACAMLRAKYNDISGVVNVFFNYNQDLFPGKSLTSRRFSKAEREQIRITLADCIYDGINGGLSAKPVFVRNLDISANPGYPLTVNLGEEYFAIGGFQALLKERIAAKEKRASAYLAEADITSCWLLIVVDGFSSHSGFDFEHETLPYPESSLFDLIIFFNAFSGKIALIYQKSVS